MGKKRTKDVADWQILEAYEQHRSAYKVSKILGIGDTTVYRVLLAHGVDRTGLEDYRKNATFFVGMEQQIREWYEAGETLGAIRKRLGKGSDYSIKYAIRRAGGTLRDNPAPLVKPDEVETIRQLHASGMGQVGISLKLGRSQSFISRIMRKHGIETHFPVGKSHGRWKGGRMTNTSGYVLVKADPEDELAQAMALHHGYVQEHRLVLARSLGRPLLRTETVHHIDGNRANNAPENLELRQGKHGKHVVMACLDCGSRRIGPVKLEDQCH